MVSGLYRPSHDYGAQRKITLNIVDNKLLHVDIFILDYFLISNKNLNVKEHRSMIQFILTRNNLKLPMCTYSICKYFSNSPPV